MSSRDDILRAVRANKPPATPLPEMGAFASPDGDSLDRFIEAVRAVGGTVVEGVSEDGLEAAIGERYADVQNVASVLPGVAQANVRLDAVEDPHELASLDLLVCEGVFGVAENGAVWLPASRMGCRAAPFLAQHLLLALDRRHIVWDMHEAYGRIAIDAEGFGLFVAGPSKTADIEQSLVIGAHGPRSLTVVLIDSETPQVRPPSRGGRRAVRPE